MRLFARLSRLTILALGLAWAGAAMVPARAQFFFPFFDNRPTKRPDTDFWGRRRDDSGPAEQRARPRPHREKPRVDAKKPKAPEPAKPQTANVDSAAPVIEGPPPPYEPQLLRLSEIMGALSYLQTICGAPAGGTAVNGDAWREQMENLMNAEAAGPSRREKLAGAYNRGLYGYEFSYHACTSNARLARQRFLDEGAQLSHDISARYRAN
ncbi:TIGR02301 family protein [Rhodoblastus sp. 17X3]|uniref:TIGR02301 family protein n=1 Tax=Rhodoblastus sp. 17X3 TaxID=3047026 RepID=UPI0024B82086|nr:TIGR02301 family protein [Rhodoblastus sp. 17X3]MDI9847586.1 TIGR02301 family protein [Rhodoblastus sp. 17X3]